MTDTCQTFDSLERCLWHICSQRPPVVYLIVKYLQVKLIPSLDLLASWTYNDLGLFAYYATLKFTGIVLS